MAAIDFPASPTVGQAFAAGNGVVYTWNGTLWLASGASAGGDFMAQYSGGITNVKTVMLLPTVLSGNSGSWYNPANGRYTPPAGRYFLYASVGEGNAAAGPTVSIYLQKNGVDVEWASNYNFQTFGSAGVQATLDANGTDYFTIAVSSVPASTVAAYSWFGAFPISGIKGPPGDPGQLGFRLLQRTVVSSAVASVDIIAIASDINDVTVHFDLTPVANDVDCFMQFYNSVGVLDTAGNYVHSLSATFSNSTIGQAAGSSTSTSSSIVGGIALTYSSANNRVSNAAGASIAGKIHVFNIRDTTRMKHATLSAQYLNGAGGAVVDVHGGGRRGIIGAITGLRLQFNTTNIASGAFSVWGSP